jgi:hypothetical protein
MHARLLSETRLCIVFDQQTDLQFALNQRRRLTIRPKLLRMDLGANMFVCGVPRNSAEFSRLLRIEEDLFGNLSVPATVAHQFFKRYPEMYTVIQAEDGAVAAYSSTYPLKRQWADALVAGDIAEPDLTPAMLIDEDESLDGCSIYIGSVVVVGEHDALTKAILVASLLSWRIQQLQAAAVSKLSIVMTAVSEQGERMIRYIGAKQLNDGAGRKDGYPIYGREISPGFVHRMTATMERCLNSGIVRMDRNFGPALQSPQSVPGLGGILVPDLETT